MECPNCGLINLESATRCDCGSDFSTKRVRGSYFTKRQSILPHASAVLYLLLGICLLILALLQLLMGLSNGAAGTIILGAWNAGVSIIYFVIAISLLRRSRRGYEWGLGSALLNIPLLILSGGLNCVNVPLVLVNAITAVMLWMSRGEYKTREQRIADDLSRQRSPQQANAVAVIVAPSNRTDEQEREQMAVETTRRDVERPQPESTQPMTELTRGEGAPARQEAAAPSWLSRLVKGGLWIAVGTVAYVCGLLSGSVATVLLGVAFPGSPFGVVDESFGWAAGFLTVLSTPVVGPIVGLVGGLLGALALRRVKRNAVPENVAISAFKSSVGAAAFGFLVGFAALPSITFLVGSA